MHALSRLPLVTSTCRETDWAMATVPADSFDFFPSNSDTWVQAAGKRASRLSEPVVGGRSLAFGVADKGA